MRNEDFARKVIDEITPEAQFTPSAYYDPDGDCVEFVAEEGPFYAERVDRWVTVYYSQETKKLIGSQIKGMRQLFRRFPNIRVVEIQDGPVGLAHLFIAIGAQPSDKGEPGSALIYKKLILAAEKTETMVELEGCCA